MNRTPDKNIHELRQADQYNAWYASLNPEQQQAEDDRQWTQAMNSLNPDTDVLTLKGVTQ